MNSVMMSLLLCRDGLRCSAEATPRTQIMIVRIFSPNVF